MNLKAEPPQSYQNRFIESDIARDYACQEYGAESYATSVWRWQAPLVEALLRECRDRAPEGRHLDFACGTGRITQVAEEIFPEVDALDISPAMVALARADCKRTHFFVGNVLENPGLCPGPYTSISTFRLLLNLDPPLRTPILAELHRRLAPGGTLLLNLHGNRHSLRQPAILWKRWRRRNAKALPPGTMLNDMSRKEVEDCLAEAGFVSQRVHGSGILPATVYRWPLRSMWRRIDRALSGLPFLKPFCIDLIFVCGKKDSRLHE